MLSASNESYVSSSSASSSSSATSVSTPTHLYHFTNSSSGFDRDTDYPVADINGFKPGGFWYCLPESVSEITSMFSYEYCYKVTLVEDCYTDLDHKNTNKILLLDSQDKVSRFADKYLLVVSIPCVGSEPYTIYHMNWEQVKKDYGGIEFGNYRKFYGADMLKMLWYSTIDFSSGCVWNLELVKDTELVADFL